MDFDAHERHIRGLLAFKEKIERMLEGALPGMDGPTPAEQLGDLRKDVAELGEAITGLQQFQDNVGGAIAALEDAKPVLAWLVDNKDGLEVLLSLGDKTAEPETLAPEGQADQGGAPEGASEAPAPETPAVNEPAAPSEAPAGEATEQPAAPTPAPAAP